MVYTVYQNLTAIPMNLPHKQQLFWYCVNE